MDASLTDEQTILKALVGKFREKQLVPMEATILGRDASDGGMGLSLEETARIDARARNLGLFGLHAPEEYGGVNLRTTTMVAVWEEMGKTVLDYHSHRTRPTFT